MSSFNESMESQEELPYLDNSFFNDEVEEQEEEEEEKEEPISIFDEVDDDFRLTIFMVRKEGKSKMKEDEQKEKPLYDLNGR